MSDYDSNINNLKCPYCDCSFARYEDEEGNRLTIDLCNDEEYDFFKCPICEKNIKISLIIHKEYDYTISKLTDEEEYLYNFHNKDTEQDVPGQIFMWE